MIGSVKFLDAAGHVVAATVDGAECTVDLRSNGYIPDKVKAWIAAGNTPLAYVPAPPMTVDQVYDEALQSQRLLRAVVLALNDGTFQFGTNRTAAQLKAIIRAKM